MLMETQLYVNHETIVPKVDSTYIKQSSNSQQILQQVWVGSQTQYDSIQTKDDNTLYIIV